jgi:hypothetical protein
MLESAALERAPSVARPSKIRSAVTNGRRLFVEGGDGRGPWARRWRDLVELHANDLGGMDSISAAQLALIRRASTIEIELEQLEARLSVGDEEVDIEAFARLAGHLRRLLEALGIRRDARQVETLADYLDTIAARRAEDPGQDGAGSTTCEPLGEGSELGAISVPGVTENASSAPGIAEDALSEPGGGHG